MNATFSYISLYVVDYGTHLFVIVSKWLRYFDSLVSEVWDFVSKFLVVYFLYLKFEIIERSDQSISHSLTAKTLRRIPFVAVMCWVVIGEVLVVRLRSLMIIKCWMFAQGLLFVTSNPLYVVFTTGDLSLVIVDVYVILQLYMVKKANPESQVILRRLVIIMTIGGIMKAATAVLCKHTLANINIL